MSPDTSFRERYAMNETTNIVRFRQPDAIDDPLTDILRTGARKLLAQAIEIEAEAFLAGMRNLKLPDGLERLVRHGHRPRGTPRSATARAAGPLRHLGCMASSFDRAVRVIAI